MKKKLLVPLLTFIVSLTIFSVANTITPGYTDISDKNQINNSIHEFIKIQNTNKATSSNQTIQSQEISLKTQTIKNDAQTNNSTKKNTTKKNKTKNEEKKEFTFTVKNTTATKYATTSLNVRSKPTSSSSKIGEYSYNQEVKVTGDVNENNWVRVEYKGKEGYVSGKYLSSTKAKPFQTVLIEDGNVSDSVMKAYDRQWKMLPSNIRNRLLNAGWKICITSYKIEEKYWDAGVGSLAGLTDPAGTVYISHRSGPLRRYTLLHEIGHAVDLELRYISDSNEFINIYNKEKATFNDINAIGDGHHTYNTLEYFAAAFCTYFQSPNTLKKSAPDTYYFIKKVVNNF